jgi:hypothetical protein
MLGVLTSRIASIAFGALPVTIFLPVFLMVLLIVLPQAFSALFGYSSPPIDAMLLVIAWALSGLWALFELWRVSWKRSVQPVVSSLGLILGLIVAFYSEYVLANLFTPGDVPILEPMSLFHDLPLKMYDLFTPSLRLFDTWLFVSPVLVASYHLFFGNAAVWRIWGSE